MSQQIPQVQRHTVKDFKTRSGSTLDVHIAYVTVGDPKNPAVLQPSCFGGKIATTCSLLGEDKTLNPKTYFNIVCALIGNGESSSPSNTEGKFHGPKFPKITYEDNMRCQYSLLQSLGVKHLRAYIGFSMGGQQAYHFAVLYPDFVDYAVCIAGSARTSWHNYCFLEGPKNGMECAEGFDNGNYKVNPPKGLKAFGRAYSAWALSPEWFRRETWKSGGYDTLEAYLQANWDLGFGFDGNDLLCLVNTWRTGNIASYEQFGGDLPKALASIKAKVLVMPSRTDAYFPPEDSEFEVKHLKQGKLAVIESYWGHLAGGGWNPDDTVFIDKQLADMFSGKTNF